MLLDPNKLSVTEFKFIKTYVAAMRREYDVLTSVMHLMHPDHLAVQCVIQAAKLARKLCALQAEFDERLRGLAIASTFKTKPDKPSPTNDQLADLFTLSFFKIVLNTPKGKSDNGMFSGEPDSWKQVFQNLQNANKHQKLSGMLDFYKNALTNLFPNLPPFFSPGSSDFKLPPNSFGPHFYFEYDKYADEDDDEDEWSDNDDYDWFDNDNS